MRRAWKDVPHARFSGRTEVADALAILMAGATLSNESVCDRGCRDASWRQTSSRLLCSVRPRAMDGYALEGRTPSAPVRTTLELAVVGEALPGRHAT